MLTSWLRHRSVPWSTFPWGVAWALGLDRHGRIVITGIPGERAWAARGVPYPPPHCEWDASGYSPDKVLSHLGVHVHANAPMHYGALYRFSTGGRQSKVLVCNMTDGGPPATDISH